VTAAAIMAPLLEPLFGGEIPVRLRFWDGSECGTVGGPVLVVRHRRALRRLLWAEPELALAQAYVTGEIDVEGDLRQGLRELWRTARERDLRMVRPTPRLLARAAAGALRLGALGLRPPTPDTQAVLAGRLHSLQRDRQAISHHYDLSNEFYALILDPNMAYSCAYYRTPELTLEQAQEAKLHLICRKLGLDGLSDPEAHRHLDIGCGWGSLSLFAAQHYGVRVLGVTIAAEQKEFIDARIAERGLGHLVEIRLQDYREIDAAPGPLFDTATSIEMGEHVGQENYPVFVSQFLRLLKPGGRVVIQQMSRTARPGGGAFIESYIAPDMHMRPVGETVSLIERGGLEVREVQALREHYTRTIDAWYDTFEANWDRAVKLVGEQMCRVWRLYLVGSALTFEEARMGVDQILAVKPPLPRSLVPMWHGQLP
jgi:cyclopropane-fatty-acyl-phospholipid synthase